MAIETPPVVGRASERAQITEAVRRLTHGAVCLEVVGEPGIGKSTILDVLRQSAAAVDAQVLIGRASEFEGDLAFGMFVDCLDRHLAGIDDGWARDLDPGALAELADIFPALQSMHRERRTAPLSSERFRAHRAVRALLEGLAATRPLVLALDDMHWADSASVELIGSLLRRPPAARVLIAIAYRPHQAPERLRRELAVAAADGVLRQIALGPLSQAEADALLTSVSSSRDRLRLFTESGGNPFYLHQLARAPSDLRPAGDLGANVPSAVAASLFAELRNVSGCARRFAQAAAVAGDPFDLDLAAQIGRLARPTALAALDELIGAALVRPAGSPLSFVFRHPLVRHAVYESAQPGWRIAAHALADAVLKRHAASPAARAHHVEHSAQIGDASAIEVLTSAAAGAVVPSVAAHWLTAALRLVSAEDEQRLGLLCRLGEALVSAGLLEHSRTALTDALELWPPRRDPDGRVRLIVLCAVVERLLGRHQHSRARLAAEADKLEDPTTTAGVTLAIELAVGAFLSNDVDSILEPAAQAMHGAAVLGDRLLLATAVTATALGGYCTGDLKSARAATAQATQLVAGLDNATLAARPDLLFHLGWAHRFLDQYEAAVHHFERGLTAARESGHSQRYIELTVGRAHALVACGRLADAQAGFDDAIEAARLSENPQPLAWALGLSLVAHVDCGTLNTAVRLGREAVSLAVDRSIVSAAGGVSLGIALAERGDFEEGLALILDWGGGVELPHMVPGLRIQIYEAMTRTEIGLGHLARAAAWANRAQAMSGNATGLQHSLAQRAIAAVALAEGQFDTAVRSALSSACGADAVHAPVAAARSRVLAGRALAAAGQRKEAGVQLRVAEAQLASSGALRLQKECVRELRRAGLRVARAGIRGDQSAQGTTALSGREREVAELVRARCTNREIAARLFLSEKTIESHLRTVFVKLGVTSRADIARALELSGP